METSKVLDDMRKLFSGGQIGADAATRTTYGADLWPRAQIWKQGGEFSRYSGACVVWPESRLDVEHAVGWCHDERVPLVPVGAGSGVCGGAMPIEGGVQLDLKRMRGLLDVDRELMEIEVEPGINGLLLEERLQRQGLTLGHYPSSIACSTAGGWVATRSAGQYSSKYGKIEDMVSGLEVITPGQGRVLTGVLAGAGPVDPWTPIFVGSEGTLGVVTRARLRVHRAPETMDFRGWGFRTPQDGLACMQRIMKSRLRPAVVRLYDPFDSVLVGFHRSTDDGQDVAMAAATHKDPWIAKVLTLLSGEFEDKGMALLLRRPELINRVAHWLPVPCLLVVGDEGSEAEVPRCMDAMATIAREQGGRDLGPGPGWSWYRNRYGVSYKQSKIFMRGAFVDTMEVATTWEQVFQLYRKVVGAMSPHVFIMAHFSHAYPEGCSIYFSFVGYRRKAADRERLYRRAWRRGLEAVTRHGATISHHHGIGRHKMGAMPREMPGGATVFQGLKQVFDPRGVMNPGKLWFDGEN